MATVGNFSDSMDCIDKADGQLGRGLSRITVKAVSVAVWNRPLFIPPAI
jgi:hypothetical protein